MRFHVVMMLMCLLGGDIYAQSHPKKKTAKFSLVKLVADSDMVYELIEIKEPFAPTWKALAGNKYDLVIHRSAPIYAMGEDKIKTIKSYINEAKTTKVFSPGNLTLHFWDPERGRSDFFDIWNYSAEFYMQTEHGAIPDNTITFPKYAGLRDDIIWLCRNRYLLQLMNKAELTAEIYQFSPHEMELLVMLSNRDYLMDLHRYAESDKQGAKLEVLYGFLDYDPAFPEKFPLLNEKRVEEFADVIDGRVNNEIMFKNLVTSYFSIRDKIKTNKYLTQRDRRLLRILYEGNDELRPYENELVELVKNEVIAKGDIKLLKPFLLRMERRQSIADLAILAEFIQSKTFLAGSQAFQELIMRQFTIRKEKEVVWILAPLIKHKDRILYIRAREIMSKITGKDLGMDPADWRKWYRDQSK